MKHIGALEEDALNSPEGLVLVQRASDQNDVVIGSHIRGARLRSSSASFEEVDLVLPGTARRVILSLYACSHDLLYVKCQRSVRLTRNYQFYQAPDPTWG